MARKDIGTLWDRENRNNMNDNFKELYKVESKAKEANLTADKANAKSDQALSNSESTQDQLDQVVIDGDSSVEAAQARVDTDGDSHQTLKERLDAEHSEVSSQLAQTVNEIGDKSTLPEWLQVSLRDVTKLHNDYLRDIAINVKSPPYNAKFDGTTDDTSILQQAIIDAENANGVVFMPEGTTIITEELFINDSVTIIGAGKNLTVLKAGVEHVNGMRVNYGANDVLIRDLQIRDIVAPENNIERRGIYVKGAKNVIIDNCKFYNCDNGGVRLASHRDDPNQEYQMTLSENCRVINCDFELMTGGDGIELIGTSKPKIFNNNIINCSRYGVRLNDAKNPIITNNYISDCERNIAIQGYTGLLPSEDFIIANNIITKARQHGIGVFGNVDRGIITDNLILESTDYGVYVRGDKDSGVYNVNIKDNVIDGGTRGVWGGGELRHLTIKDNKIKNIGDPNNLSYNIYVNSRISGTIHNMRDVFIQGNEIYRSEDDGSVHYGIAVSLIPDDEKFYVLNNYLKLNNPEHHIAQLGDTTGELIKGYEHNGEIINTNIEI